MGNEIRFGIRVAVDGQSAVPDIERIGTAAKVMAADVTQAGNAMATAFDAGTAAVSKSAQASTTMAESEEAATARIRAMVAASLQKTTALAEAEAAAEREAASTRQAAEANANYARTVAAANAQMTAPRQSAQANSVSSDESQKYLASLQRQHDQVGKNAAELAQYEAKLLGGSKALQTQAYALASNTEALRQQIAAEERSGQAADNFIAKLKEQTATLGMNRTQLLEYKAAQLGVSEAAAPMIAKLAEAGTGAHGASKHLDGLNFSSVGARRELLVLAHELSQGQYSRFGGSMMVLGEQTGAAGLLFSAAGIAALTLTAAVVGVGYAMIKGASDQKHMNDALIMTGNYAGMTSDSLNDLAHAAVASGGSIGQAKKAATELAASGKFTGDQIGYITEAVVAQEHATGRSIEKTIKEFESLAVQSSGSSARATEVISRATLKLDDTYHFLTESVYEQIRALEKEGNAKAASALATETLAKVTHERAEEILGNTGNIARGWNAVKEAIGGAVDAVGDWGKKSTPASETARIQKEIAQIDNGSYAAIHGGSRDSYDQATLLTIRAGLVKELAKAQADLNAVNDKAAADSAKRMAESEASHAASRILADDAKLQKKGMSELQLALDQYYSDIEKIKKANPKSILVTPESIAEHVEAITKAHTKPAERGDDDRAKVLQDSLLREQTALEREKNIYDQREKMLSAYHNQFGMSDADFYAGRKAARAEYIAAEAIAFAREASLIKSFQGKNPQEIAANQQRYDTLLKQHLDFSDKMRAQLGDDAVSQAAIERKIASDSEDATNKYLADLGKEAQKIEEFNVGREQSRGAIERETVARLDLAIAYQRQFMADQVAMGATAAELEQAPKILKYLEDQRALRERMAIGLDKTDADKAMKKGAEQAIQDWKLVGASIADSLSSAFGSAGKAVGNMTRAYADNAARQLQITKQLAESTKGMDANNPERIKATERAQRESAQAQVKSYGDMAGAAKGFFKESSTGYKVLEGIEKGFRAFELAMAVESMVKKIAFKETEVGANIALNATKLTGEAATTAASTGLAATEASAWGITAVVKAIASLPFPLNLAAGAATLAAVVAVGAKLVGGIGGGGGDTTAKDRQAATGTGSVLGDKTAKSDSIARAVELSAANSSIGLSHTAAMQASLRNIESSLSGLGNLLVRTSGLTGNLAPKSKGAAADFASSTVGVALVGGVIGLMLDKITGGFIGKITGSIANSIFGGKTTALDTGVTVGKSSVGDVLSRGVVASQYTDIKKDGGWFHSDKYSTQLAALGTEANSQFGKVIAELASSVTEAGKLLGVGGDEFTQHLNSFVIDIGKISLKGLSGEEIQKQLEAAFSKVGDDMAKYAVDGLAGLQHVGEGYFETLARVASDYANLDSILTATGSTFGATGVQSLTARERLIELGGGIDKLASQSSAYADNFLTQAERLAPVSQYVTEQLAAMGLAGIDTREKFKETVQGLASSGALATEAGAKQYTGLLALADAFAKTHAATVDLTKSQQEIADEHKDLQDQYDQLTMTSVALLKKQRDAIDESNRALFDSVQARQLDNAKRDLEIQVMELQGKSVAALAARRAVELAGMNDALVPMQKLAWALDDLKNAQSAYDSALSSAKSAVQTAATQFKTFVDNVTTAQKNFAAAQKAISDEYGKAVAADKTAKDAVKKAQDDITSGYVAASEKVAQAQQKVVDAFAKLGSTLGDFLDSLDTSDLAGASLANREAALQAQFATVAAQAKAGDADAAEKLPEIAKNLLTVSKDTSASSLDFARMVGYVRTTITDVKAMAAGKVGDGKASDESSELEKALAEQARWADAVKSSGASFTKAADSLLTGYVKAVAEQHTTSEALAYWASVAGATNVSLLSTEAAMHALGDNLIKGFNDSQMALRIAQIELAAAYAIKVDLDLRQTSALENFVVAIKDVNTTAKTALDAAGKLFTASGNKLLEGSDAAVKAQVMARDGMVHWGNVVTSTAAGIAASVQAMATAAAAIATAQAANSSYAESRANETLVRGWYKNNSQYLKGGENVTQPEVDYWLNVLTTHSVEDTKQGFAAAAARDHGFATPLDVSQFATGAAFRNGVVSRPTKFNMGEMGEDGPEAIMPLANVGGHLGVRMVGGGGNNVDLVGQFRILTDAVERLETALGSIDGSTSKTASIMQRVTRDGEGVVVLEGQS